MTAKSLRDQRRCWSCMKVLANDGSWSRHQRRCPAQNGGPLDNRPRATTTALIEEKP